VADKTHSGDDLPPPLEPTALSVNTIARRYHAILSDAFDRRRAQVGGDAVILDSVVEIAHALGFPGGRTEAEHVLRTVGGFTTGVTLHGQIAVWRNSP